MYSGCETQNTLEICNTGAMYADFDCEIQIMFETFSVPAMHAGCETQITLETFNM